MSCPGWVNCIGTPAGLSYTFLVAPKGVVPTVPLFRGSNNSISLRLPAGDPNDQFRSQVTVVISDGIGESRETVVYPVTVSVYTSRLNTGRVYNELDIGWIKSD